MNIKEWDLDIDKNNLEEWICECVMGFCIQ